MHVWANWAGHQGSEILYVENAQNLVFLANSLTNALGFARLNDKMLKGLVQKKAVSFCGFRQSA
jgi:hypothetical protein